MYLSNENFTCPKEQIMHKELSLAKIPTVQIVKKVTAVDITV